MWDTPFDSCATLGALILSGLTHRHLLARKAGRSIIEGGQIVANGHGSILFLVFCTKAIVNRVHLNRVPGPRRWVLIVPHSGPGWELGPLAQTCVLSAIEQNSHPCLE